MFKNLQAEQARKGMSNTQVSEFLGISRTSYENKKKTGKFNVFEITKMCALFNCKFDYLFAIDKIS